MPGARLELARLCGAVDFESTASANSAIPARKSVQDLTGKSSSLASPVRRRSQILPRRLFPLNDQDVFPLLIALQASWPYGEFESL